MKNTSQNMSIDQKLIFTIGAKSSLFIVSYETITTTRNNS